MSLFVENRRLLLPFYVTSSVHLLSCFPTSAVTCLHCTPHCFLATFLFLTVDCFCLFCGVSYLPQAGRMADRGRYHERSDAYADRESRDEDYSDSRRHDYYKSRGRNQKPRDADMRGSAGDRGAKHSRQRDETPPSDEETPAYYPEGTSRL